VYVKPGGCAIEKVRRDEEIVGARARGMTWRAIAKRHGLSERRCRNIWSARPEAVSCRAPTDLEATVDEALEGYDAAIEDLAVLAASTTNPSVRLGAINSRLRALDQKLTLMQGLGLLPRDLDQFAVILDSRRVAATLLEVFDAYGVSEEAREAVRAAIATGRQPSRERVSERHPETKLPA
jgi:hypothetical protein